MHKGRLIRIILVILIIGMAGFMVIRNNSLKKQLDSGQITEITAKDFLPFGNNDGSTIGDIIRDILPGGGDEGDSAVNTTGYPELIAENVAGSIIVRRDDEIAGETGVDAKGNKIYDQIDAIRYVSRENGYIYDYIPKYSNSYLISDTALPRVLFADFSPDGNRVLFRYLDADMITEKSVLGTLGRDSVKILPDNIISFDFAKDGEFIYISKNQNGSSIFMEKSAKDELVYSSPISEWHVKFINKEKLLLTTKATELAPGFAYTLDLKNKKLTKIWGNLNGLTTKVSPDGNYILRAVTEQSGPVMSTYNLKDGTMRQLGKMGLVEKCSWSSDETIFTCAVPKSFDNVLYPDAWYSGEIETNDGIVRYTTMNLNAREMSQISSDAQNPIDVWKTSINNSGNLISFINKKNMSLWSYEE